MNALEFLRAVPIFAGVSDDALQLLATAAQPAEFDPPACIVRQGDPGNVMFLIEQGRVEIVRDEGTPRERMVAGVTARDFFGEMCLIESMPRSASVRAVAHTRLWRLSSFDLYRLYERQPDQYAIVILNVARDLCRRLRALDETFAGKA